MRNGSFLNTSRKCDLWQPMRSEVPADSLVITEKQETKKKPPPTQPVPVCLLVRSSSYLTVYITRLNTDYIYICTGVNKIKLLKVINIHSLIMNNVDRHGSTSDYISITHTDTR